MNAVQVREQLRYIPAQHTCGQPGPRIQVIGSPNEDSLGLVDDSFCCLEKGHNGDCFWVTPSDKDMSKNDKPF